MCVACDVPESTRTPENWLKLGAGLVLEAPGIWLVSTNTPSIEAATVTNFKMRCKHDYS